MLSQYSGLACYSTDRFPGRISGTEGIGYTNGYEMGIDRLYAAFGKILLGGKCPFVRTKTLSGQKNCPDNLFCPGCQCPRFFVFIISCPSGPWFVVLSQFCPYFCPVLISEIFNNFLGILWAQIITTCIIKLLSKVPDIPLKMSSLKGWGDCVWR